MTDMRLSAKLISVKESLASSAARFDLTAAALESVRENHQRRCKTRLFFGDHASGLTGNRPQKLSTRRQSGRPKKR
jgi:hypothetical protein